MGGLATVLLAFERPMVDFHALAPEIVLVAVISAMIIADVVLLDRGRAVVQSMAGIGLLAPLIPILTLAMSDDTSRAMFDGAFVVDRWSLLLKAMFLVSGYVVVLLATNYVAEGEYWESEFYTLLASSVLGMLVMASARDLVSIFVALELLSIPAYLLAAWRKGDEASNEAGMKYYLMGVFASAILLYGMSLVYGLTGSTLLSEVATRLENNPASVLAITFVIVGFAFKVSAVPFHSWAPDTYEGAPTPLTAYLAVASKAAGFVALLNVVFFGFLAQDKVITPVMFVLSVLSMTVGNLIALRQTNIVRMLAYSGIAQAGFMLAPFAVATSSADSAAVAFEVVIAYLVIYAAMNLGAFAVVIAAARRTGSAELDSMKGMFHWAPGLTVIMTAFLAALVGIPPLGGWYAKFGVIRSVIGADNGVGLALGIVLAINTAIAAYYYLNVARVMWFDEPETDDLTPVEVPPALKGALAITLIATLVLGVFPQIISGAATVTGLAAGG